MGRGRGVGAGSARGWGGWVLAGEGGDVGVEL